MSPLILTQELKLEQSSVNETYASPTSIATRLTFPALSAMYTASLELRGSMMIARILDGSWIGLPCLFLDFNALRLVSAREWLHVGGR